MSRYDFRSPRLFLDAPLAAETQVALERAQAHYLTGVLRLGAGAQVLVFNGREGEWRALLEPHGKRDVRLSLVAQTRPQEALCDLDYLFAPLKHSRLDYMVQKAVEMGVSRLQPVLTRRTQAERINLERMRANAIEAAEQCGILQIAAVAPPLALERALAAMGRERIVVFCDEDAPVRDPAAALVAAMGEGGARPLAALLIGPEGGFAPEERDALLARPRVVRLALGPRILRADTAAVAALALMQTVWGDWR